MPQKGFLSWFHCLLSNQNRGCCLIHALYLASNPTSSFPFRRLSHSGGTLIRISIFIFSLNQPSTATLQFNLQTSTALGPSQSSSAMDYPLFMVPRYLMGIVVINVLSFICGAVLLLVGLLIESNRHFVYDFYTIAFPMSFMIFILCAVVLFLLCVDLTHYRGFFVVNSEQIICIGFAVCLICSFELSAFISATLLKNYVFRISAAAIKTEIQMYPAHRLNASFSAADSARRLSPWIDTLQTSLSCCGAQSWSDWKNRFANTSLPSNSSSPTGVSEFVLPISCCRSKFLVRCERNVSSHRRLPDSIFDQPCLPVVKDVLDRDAFIFGLACFSIFALQISSLLITCLLNRRSSDRSIQSM